MASRVNDSGYKALLQNLKDANDLTIEAGIFKESRASRSKTGSAADNLDYRLRIHDQGLGNNPQRKVLEPALRAFSSDFDSIMKPHFDRMTVRGTVKRGANSAGQRLAAQIKRQFALAKPRKTRATIEAAKRRYGGGARSTTLIQTGEMRRAVKWKVR